MAETTTATAKGNTGSGETTATTGETKPAAGETTAATGETTPATGETTPGDQAAQKPAGTDGAAQSTSKAPEKYALTVPEGAHVSAVALQTIEALARTNGLSNDEAQKLVTFAASTITAESARFRQEAEADPVYGGAHLEETKKHAAAGLAALRPAGHPRAESFRQFLEASGHGNHIEVVSLLADLGKLMAEDGSAGSSGTSAGSRDPATVLYGSPTT